MASCAHSWLQTRCMPKPAGKARLLVQGLTYAARAASASALTLPCFASNSNLRSCKRAMTSFAWQAPNDAAVHSTVRASRSTWALRPARVVTLPRLSGFEAARYISHVETLLQRGAAIQALQKCITKLPNREFGCLIRSRIV